MSGNAKGRRGCLFDMETDTNDQLGPNLPGRDRRRGVAE